MSRLKGSTEREWMLAAAGLDRETRSYSVAAAAIGFFAVLAAWDFAGTALSSRREQMVGFLLSGTGRLAAVAATLAAGGFFYWLRSTRRLQYGAVEVLIGLTSTWRGMDRAAEGPLGFTVMLMGSVYLVVRGLDNMFVAYKAGKADAG